MSKFQLNWTKNIIKQREVRLLRGTYKNQKRLGSDTFAPTFPLCICISGHFHQKHDLPFAVQVIFLFIKIKLFTITQISNFYSHDKTNYIS